MQQTTPCGYFFNISSDGPVTIPQDVSAHTVTENISATKQHIAKAENGTQNDASDQRTPNCYGGIKGKIPSCIAKYELFSYLCAPKRSSGRIRAHSSVGQSSGLIIRRSWDHAPLGPQKKRLRIAVTSFFALFGSGVIPASPRRRPAFRRWRPFRRTIPRRVSVRT